LAAAFFAGLKARASTKKACGMFLKEALTTDHRTHGEIPIKTSVSPVPRWRIPRW